MKSLGLIAALSCAATASAELVTLCDISSGSASDINWISNGNAVVPFAIESSGMTWRGGGHATDGVVRAWDSEANAPAIGAVTFTADEGWLFERLHFDVSGFKEYERQADVRIFLDGELFRDYTWNFNGNDTLIHWGMDLASPVSTISIELEYYDGVQYAAGLDNIELGSFSTVPAPGVLALLGIAGVAGNRRRRG